MVALVVALVVIILILSGWLIYELKHPLVPPIVDKTKLDSSFDAIQAQEKAKSNETLSRFDTEDRVHLLDDLNRKPRM